MRRDAPVNCQQEPSYPGLVTVTFAIAHPDVTAHLPTARCPDEYPHAIAECGEWSALAR